MDGLAGSQKAWFPLRRPWTMESDFHSFFRRRFFSHVFDVGSMLGGFGRPKWRPKSISGTFFWDAFFECVLGSILGGFLEAPKLENNGFPIGKLQISQNRRFRKKCEKTSILESFSEAKTTKNREKIVLKNGYVFYIVFFAFCLRIFAILARFWEAPGPPKIEKNQKKSMFFRVPF